MFETWHEIVGWYARMRGAADERPFWTALDGVERLARHIAQGPLGSALYGWRSMFELCVQQTDHEPFSCPYLKVSPQHSGLIEFRYFDTMITSRQWHRSVRPDQTIDRFERFLDQLRWIAPPSRKRPKT